MAYEQGTFNTATALRNAIKTFAINIAGFSNPSGNILQLTDGIYYDFGTTIASDTYFGAGGAEYIKFNAGTGQSGGALTGAFLTTYFPAIRGCTTGRYWCFFMSKILHVVVEAESGKYQHLHIGKITDYNDAVNPNDFITASFNSYPRIADSLNPEGSLSAGTASAGANTLIENTFYTKGINYHNGTLVLQNANTYAYNIFAGGVATVTTKIYLPTYMSVRASHREGTGLPVLCPIYYSDFQGTSPPILVKIRGEFDGVRQIDAKYIAPETVLNYGAEEWQVFPAYINGTSGEYAYVYRRV